MARGRIHAVLKYRDGLKVTRKKVHRIIKLNNWQKQGRRKGMRRRVKGRRHATTHANQLWTIDTTSIFFGKDGWRYLTAVIDCFDRTIVGWWLAPSGKTQIATAALEDALRSRKIKNKVSMLL